MITVPLLPMEGGASGLPGQLVGFTLVGAIPRAPRACCILATTGQCLPGNANPLSLGSIW